MNVKLDALDKKIIRELNQNPRATYSQIGRAVQASKENVNYRIKRLTKNEVIIGVVTIFDFEYSSYKLLVQLHNIDPTKEKEMLEKLKQMQQVNWITPCSGNWDLIFSIMAKTPKDFDNILRKVLSEIEQYVENYDVGISIGSETYGYKSILGDVKPPKSHKKEGTKQFDEKDILVAKEIQNDARKKLIDIAQNTGLSIEIVRHRIKRMEEDGRIKRYRLVLNPQTLGYQSHEFFIKSASTSKEFLRKFEEYTKQNEKITYYSRCVGMWDLELSVLVKSSQELRELLLEIKDNFGENIKNIKTTNLFQTLNYTFIPEEFL